MIIVIEGDQAGKLTQSTMLERLSKKEKLKQNYFIFLITKLLLEKKSENI